MTSFVKRWARRLVFWLGLLVFLAAFGYWQWSRQLATWGVSDWQVSVTDWSLTHLAFDQARLEGDHQGRDYRLAVVNGRVDWRWQGWRPQLEKLAVGQLNLNAGVAPLADEEQATSDWPLPADWHLPEFMPNHLSIDRLQWGDECPGMADTMPPGIDSCFPPLKLDALLSTASARLTLALLDGPEAARLTMGYQVEAGLPRLELQLGAVRFARLQALLVLAPVEAKDAAQSASLRQWQLDLDAGLSRPDEQWQAYLRHWLPGLDTQHFDQINADWGVGVDELRLRIRSALEAKAMSAAALNQLPLVLELQTQGKLRSRLNATLAIDPEVLAVSLREGQAQIELDAWSAEVIQLSQLSFSHAFEADWGQGQLRYQSLGAGGIAVKRISGPDWAMEDVQLQIPQFVLAGDPHNWRQLALSADVQANLGKLSHPALHPLPWRWQGQLRAAEGRWQLKGELVAAEQLQLRSQWVWQAESLQLNAELDDVFLLAGNGLQQLSPHWPGLLSLERGRLGAKAELNWQLPASTPRGLLSFQMTDLGGAYDTSVFNGLTGEVLVKVAPEQFDLRSEKLQMKELVQGFSLGPLAAAASYSASWSAPAQGELQLDQLEGELLNGRLRLQPARVNLATLPQPVIVDLEEIDLARLLAEHPSSDITGTGRLSGRLPLTVSDKGVTLSEGRLAALAPGGQLQYRSPRAAALAESNPGMKIITDALDDFHYSVLASEVTYEDSGRLLLALRLQGSNPAVEGGRQINFNINLEEDLPALLASLQLSNQISDRIKRRVQEKLRQR